MSTNIQSISDIMTLKSNFPKFGMLHNFTSISSGYEVFIGSFIYGKRIVSEILLKVLVL